MTKINKYHLKNYIFSETEKLMGYIKSKKLPFVKFEIEGSFENFTNDDLLTSIKNCHDDERNILKRQLILIYLQRTENYSILNPYDDTDDSSKHSLRVRNYGKSIRKEIDFALTNGLLFYYIELVKYKANWEYDFLNPILFMKLINKSRKIYIERVLSRFPNEHESFTSEYVSFIKNTPISTFNKLQNLIFERCDITLEIIRHFFMSKKTDKVNFIRKYFISTNIELFERFIQEYDDNEDYYYRIFTNAFGLVTFYDEEKNDLETLDQQNQMFFDILSMFNKLESYFLWLIEEGYFYIYDNQPKVKKIIDYIFNEMLESKEINGDRILSSCSFKKIKFFLNYVTCEDKSCCERIFCMLCEMGDLLNAKEIYKLGLIEHDCNGWYPIIKSLEHGHIDIVEWLMSIYQYDLTVNNFMLYENVAFYGLYEAFDWLLKYKNITDFNKLYEIKIKCCAGFAKGKLCYQESKFSYTNPNFLFGDNERNHLFIIDRIDGLLKSISFSTQLQNNNKNRILYYP